MTLRYIRCELFIINELQTKYKDEYNDDPIDGEVRKDPLVNKAIETLIERVAHSDDYCARNDYEILGLALYKLIFDDNISKKFESTYSKFIKRKNEDPKDPDLRLRLTLLFHKPAERLASYPWEFIAMPTEEHNYFLAGEKTELILTRKVPTPPIGWSLEPESRPLRILVVYSHPKKLSQIEGQNITDVIDAIEQLEVPDEVEVKKMENPTFAEVCDLISTSENGRQKSVTFKPHIFHFIGHGEPGKVAFYKGDKEIESEAIEKGTDKSKVDDYVWVQSPDFHTLFDEYQPKLVFLQSCSGAEAELRTFKDIASILVRECNILAVIAMQYEIVVKDAKKFTVTVYKMIDKGMPIGEAVKEGRRQLGRGFKAGYGSWGSRRFATPVIYLQAEKMIIKPKTQRKTGTDIIKPPPEPDLCPYPNCSAYVKKNQQICLNCGKDLDICPKCGEVMATTIGRCGMCKYEIGKEARIVKPMAKAASKPGGEGVI